MFKEAGCIHYCFVLWLFSFAAYMCVMEYDVTCCYGLLQVTVGCSMTSFAIVIHILVLVGVKTMMFVGVMQ